MRISDWSSDVCSSDLSSLWGRIFVSAFIPTLYRAHVDNRLLESANSAQCPLMLDRAGSPGAPGKCHANGSYSLMTTRSPSKSTAVMTANWLPLPMTTVAIMRVLERRTEERGGGKKW